MTKLRSIPSLLLGTLLASGCVGDDLGEDELGSAESAINGGALALSWMYQRAVEPQFPCSATLIGPRHVLTAMHCTQYNKVGTTVKFYANATTLTGARQVIAVHRPLGTSPDPLDRHDWAGKFADVAVLKLDGDAPVTSMVAAMEWSYPGADAFVVIVGSGTHDGMDNPDSELRFTVDNMASASDSSGYISTYDANANPGDSGGSLYYYGRLLGVIGTTSGFTSVPLHLPWILDVMDWVWPYGAVATSTKRMGTVMDSFSSIELVCQYACASTTDCSAYNFYSSTCELMYGATTPLLAFGVHSDVKL